MKAFVLSVVGLTLLSAMAFLVVVGLPRMASEHASQSQERLIERGKQLYLTGTRLDGSPMTGRVQGDVTLTGAQVVCANCHRLSAMGSNEGANDGAQVVPPLRGEILFKPLRLPTSKPPLAPVQRPAYSQGSLRSVIRDGVNASGKSLSPAMPRYPLSDEEIDAIAAYLQSLMLTPAPGVTDNEIHLATVIGKSTPPETRKALLDVFGAFIDQKNSESRHESKRAEHAPWHEAWTYESYRKWVLHVWELEGNESSWPAQLERQYHQQPIFALVGGTATGDWRPVHEFCQRNQLPCLFPITRLPVITEQNFYSVYLDKGMSLQGEIVAQHLGNDRNPIVQVFMMSDSLGKVASDSLRKQLEGQNAVKDIGFTGDADWPSIITQSNGGALVLWLGERGLAGLWGKLNDIQGPRRIYLSTSLFGETLASIPETMRDRVYFVHPYEMPAKLPKSLLRSNGWLRAKKIYAPDQELIQADSYLALTLTGMALNRIRGYFYREYFLEGLEHLVDNATFTSRYPRISLAPGQRFIAKGAYVAKLDAEGELEPATDWMIPDAR